MSSNPGPPPPTLEDQEAVGHMVDGAVSRIPAITIFYGIFLAMFAYSTVLSLKRKSRIILLTSILALVGATINWAATLHISLSQFRGAYVHNLDQPFMVRVRAVTPTLWTASLLQEWSLLLVSTLCDVIVLWRAYAVYRQTKERWILAVPTAFLFAAVVTTVVYLSYISHSYAYWVKWQRDSGAPFINNMQQAGYILSLVTNSLATFMILYKLWSHRRFVKALSGGTRTKRLMGGADGAFVIIIESGLVYSAFQAVMVALTMSPGDSVAWRNEFLALLFMQLYPFLSAIYPVAVTILVQLHFSQSDVVSREITREIQFAQSPDSTAEQTRRTEETSEDSIGREETKLERV